LRKHLFARLVALAIVATAALAFASSALGQNYVVLYKQSAVPADSAAAIQKAGGTFVYAYPQIGVAIASSDSSSFRANLLKDSKIENAAGTAGYGIQVDGVSTEAAEGDLPNAPATDTDTLTPLQWDMRQIHTPQAHAITGGSPSVVVGDIDTGLDFTHPDISPNYDAANSTDCSSGTPQPLLPGNDRNGHGTHTAGTIAAASNGVGIVGVAPNVRIAGIKSSNDDGFFFPEMVVCSFMWAGSHHIDVTNNSYFADPFLFNCRNDPVQRAIWKAEQRAIRFAMQSGVTVVAAAGNEAEDLSHPTMDVTSPDFPPGTSEEREVTNACVVIPVEIPGVIGVSATSSYDQGTDAGQYPDNLKSFFSTYGVSAIDVAAPGGDSRYGTPPFNTAVTGRVLSSWPLAAQARCVANRRVVDPGAPAGLWCWQQGTSMASPHAAGVAALIISRYGTSSNPGNGKLRPGQVEALVQQTADPQACPETFPLVPVPYLSFTGTQSGAVQSCSGGPGHNSWYGSGQVDALGAVSR
jgi:lantibiotic leader peptide-processing serine protease